MANDIRKLDRRAVEASTGLVAAMSTDDLGRVTPCTGWTLCDLLAHMTAQHRGFAAAAAGDGGDLTRWAVDPSADDPVRDYLDSARDVIAAFAGEGVLDRAFMLPEIRAGGAFPGSTAIAFHFVDYLVHSWDVSRSLGLAWEPDADLVGPALRITRNVPNGAERLEPGAAFAPGTDPDPGAPAFDQILHLLGRSPRWPD